MGDIHGELSALQDLVRHLGYDEDGRHPQSRTLVFVGDFVDRGPDSPGVVSLVQRLVESGHASAIAGNHEINLLRHDPKDGAGWFFEEACGQRHGQIQPICSRHQHLAACAH